MNTASITSITPRDDRKISGEDILVLPSHQLNQSISLSPPRQKQRFHSPPRRKRKYKYNSIGYHLGLTKCQRILAGCVVIIWTLAFGGCILTSIYVMNFENSITATMTDTTVPIVSKQQQRVETLDQNIPQQQQLEKPIVLSVPKQRQHAGGEVVTCTATADVRGNLGPVDSVLSGADDNSDWLQHRWQAASDMHGTQITGYHTITLTWNTPVRISSVQLDWETAYSDQYVLQVLQTEMTKNTTAAAPLDQQQYLPIASITKDMLNENKTKTISATTVVMVSTSGQSPGVKRKMPLHVMHDIEFVQSPSTKQLQLLMQHSATGWGVSVWEFKVYGYCE